MVERHPHIEEKQPVEVPQEIGFFLKAVDKSRKDPQNWGKKRTLRFIAGFCNALSRKGKRLKVDVAEFVHKAQVGILEAVGDPLVKNPPEDNLAKKGLCILRRWKAMADARRKAKKK